MSDGPVFIEKIDYEAAAAVLRKEEERWRAGWNPLPFNALAGLAIDAALVGVREAKVEERCGVCELSVSDHGWRGAKKAAKEHLVPTRRFVTEWPDVWENE